MRRRRFAGFEILADLGSYRGTRSYKAIQLALHRVVVLHVLPPHAAKRADCVAHFDRQRRVAAALRHENVISAIDAGEHQGARYFVTEFVPGQTLHQLIAVVPRWDVSRALAVGLDVARALAHLEDLDLVHRSVTLATIVIEESGRARLVDFTKTKYREAGGAETTIESTLETSPYVSPEAARGDRGLDVRSDVYSLGCVLFHLLTGRPPFVGPNEPLILEAHVKTPPPDPRQFRPDLPAPIASLILRCLAKRREDRPQTAAALAAEIEALASGRAGGAGSRLAKMLRRPLGPFTKD